MDTPIISVSLPKESKLLIDADKLSKAGLTLTLANQGNEINFTLSQHVATPTLQAFSPSAPPLRTTPLTCGSPHSLFGPNTNHTKSPNMQTPEEELHFPISLEFLSLNDVITRSTLRDNDHKTQIQNIINTFNHTTEKSPEKSLVKNSRWFGKKIKENEMWLVERKGQIELVANQEKRIRLRHHFFSRSTHKLGAFDCDSPMIQYQNHTLINVPPGKYAKVWNINSDGSEQPGALLGEGPHVMHDAKIRIEFINQATTLIQHGKIAILQVPEDKQAQISLNNQIMLLPANKKPYVIENETLSLLEIINSRQSLGPMKCALS